MPLNMKADTANINQQPGITSEVLARGKKAAGRNVQQARSEKVDAEKNTRQAAKGLQEARIKEQEATQKLQKAQSEHQKISRSNSLGFSRGSRVNVVV